MALLCVSMESTFELAKLSSERIVLFYLIIFVFHQEFAQMEAFHVLQLQTDDKHKRITNQVSTSC